MRLGRPARDSFGFSASLVAPGFDAVVVFSVDTLVAVEVEASAPFERPLGKTAFSATFEGPLDAVLFSVGA